MQLFALTLPDSGAANLCSELRSKVSGGLAYPQVAVPLTKHQARVKCMCPWHALLSVLLARPLGSVKMTVKMLCECGLCPSVPGPGRLLEGTQGRNANYDLAGPLAAALQLGARCVGRLSVCLCACGSGWAGSGGVRGACIQLLMHISDDAASVVGWRLRRKRAAAASTALAPAGLARLLRGPSTPVRWA